MKVFAISDLHLTTTTNKPMNVFGGAWENYWEDIQTSWRSLVSDDDLVLISGDISWAMYLADAVHDLELIHALPGKKIIIRGNHDYWWNAYSKVQAVLPQSIIAIQNNAVRFDGLVVCGTRGWSIPTASTAEGDVKIYNREIIRLGLTLQEGKKLEQEGDKLLLMMHYPPFNGGYEDSGFTALIDENDVDVIIYGHLHGKDNRAMLELSKHGRPYFLTSCDQMSNCLKLILEI